MKLNNYRYEITLTNTMFNSVPADTFHIDQTHRLRSHVLADKYNPFVFFCQVLIIDIST